MRCDRLVEGVELSLLESTHYFIYALHVTAYRLVEVLKTGHTQFDHLAGYF